MNIDDLLARLDGVRKTGANHWVAKCPAHTERTPSLSIACGEDGRILLHDFAGCTVHAVLAAMGLEVGDLFEQRMRPRTRAERHAAMQAARVGDWQAALNVLAHEATCVQAAAAMLRSGMGLSDKDQQRLAEACQRIEGARNRLAPNRQWLRDMGRVMGK